jgi:hypothetical protein
MRVHRTVTVMVRARIVTTDADMPIMAARGGLVCWFDSGGEVTLLVLVDWVLRMAGDGVDVLGGERICDGDVADGGDCEGSCDELTGSIEFGMTVMVVRACWIACVTVIVTGAAFADGHAVH